MDINKAAQAMGRKGGQSTSIKKQEAARANFAKARKIKANKTATPAIQAVNEGVGI